jgi:hypothetical protein
LCGICTYRTRRSRSIRSIFSTAPGRVTALLNSARGCLPQAIQTGRTPSEGGHPRVLIMYPWQPDFVAINTAALADLPVLLARWLPDGRVIGREFEARNPRRADRNPGSFRINLRTGRWCDFASEDRGGDPVSLVAFLFDLKQTDAARRLATLLGLP